MPDTLYRNTQSRWLPGSIPQSSPGGTQRKDFQNGYKTRKNERKTQVLPYSGVRYSGSVERYLPHLTYKSWVYPVGYSSSTPVVGDKEWNDGEPTYGDVARNRAYAKFKDVALGDQAQIGTFIAEGREAYGLIANRAIGLYKAYKALRKGKFREFLRHLSTDPKRKHRNLIRSARAEASGLWLEYWFGWSPTLADMFTAVEVLNKDLKQVRYFGVGGTRLPARSTGDYPPPTSNGRATITAEGVFVYKTGASIKVTNPDLLLASRLGLINPLSIAWEVVPFSFVVDWFAKIGNVLEAKTDFLGLDLLDPYTTAYLNAKSTFETWDRRAGPGYNGRYVYGVHRMRRTKGLISPVVLNPKLVNFGQSRTRAATAVSLLNQIFLAK